MERVLVVEPGEGASRFDRSARPIPGQDSNAQNLTSTAGSGGKGVDLVLPRGRGFPITRSASFDDAENADPDVGTVVIVVDKLDLELLEPVDDFVRSSLLFRSSSTTPATDLIVVVVEPAKAAAPSLFFAAEPESLSRFWDELAQTHGATLVPVLHGMRGAALLEELGRVLNEHAARKVTQRPNRQQSSGAAKKAIARRGSATKWFQKKQTITVAEELNVFGSITASLAPLTTATARSTLKQIIRDTLNLSEEGVRLEVIAPSNSVKEAVVVRSVWNERVEIGVIKLKHLDLELELDLAKQLQLLEENDSGTDMGHMSLQIHEELPPGPLSRIALAIGENTVLDSCAISIERLDKSVVTMIETAVSRNTRLAQLSLEFQTVAETDSAIAVQLTRALRANSTLQSLSIVVTSAPVVAKSIESAIEPFLAANRLLADIADVPEVQQNMSFFSKEVEGQKNRALLACATLGKVDAISRLVACGACASARTDDNLLCHTIVMRHDVWDEHHPQRQHAMEALAALLKAHWEFDFAAREVLDMPGRYVALLGIVQSLSAQGWRSPNKGTVVHVLLETCRSRTKTMKPEILRRLCEAAIGVGGASLTRTRNLLGQTPRDLAMSLDDDYQDVRSLFVEVLFTRYRLDADICLYRSSSSCIWQCTDIGAGASNVGIDLVIKLCESEEMWCRELAARSKLTKGGGQTLLEPVVGVLACCAVTSHMTTPVAAALDGVPMVAVTPAEVAQGSVNAIKLLGQFPFGLVMPKADLNLLEASSKFELAKSPLSELQRIAKQVAMCVGQMHTQGCIHADVKPRNIVSIGHQYKLIDLDMATGFDVGSGQLLGSLADTKLLSSSAYLAPEIYRCIRTKGTTEGAGLFGLRAAQQVDIWSFAATLFELLVGKPLVSNTYDAVDERGEHQLLSWDGIPAADKRLLQRHGERETVAVLDLLEWCLECDPAARPASMATVLEHSFFSPTTGSLREHIAVEEIRQSLEDPARSVRIAKTVMISYCWESTPFVLRLCRDLAPQVGNLMLDRLGGDRGMDEWVQESMNRMVKSADVVISVVTKGYVRSQNCALEMQMADVYGKQVIPINLELAHADWMAELRELGPPGAKIPMRTQYLTPDGDVKLYVDFKDRNMYTTKLQHELLPKLMGGVNDRGPDQDQGHETLATALEEIARLKAEIAGLRRCREDEDELTGTAV